jgi:hypothetical protein
VLAQDPVLRYKERDRGSEDIDGFPCSTGKNSKKCRIQAIRGLNTTLQEIDSIGVNAKFRCTAEQRNFGSGSAELYGCSPELQRNLSVHK